MTWDLLIPPLLVILWALALSVVVSAVVVFVRTLFYDLWR